ncbi:MAG: membrane protein insertase YidC [Proteobacteria bacterium]|nr:membrane protein insertase YidC [Pseudomonadota bacterium]
MKFLKKLTSNQHLFTILLVFVTLTSFATTDNKSLTLDLNDSQALNKLIDMQVKEQYQFSGLAMYLNQVQYYIVDKDIHDLDLSETINLEENQWLAISGRFKVLLIKAPGANIAINAENRKISISNASINAESIIISKAELKQFADQLDQIRYNHLWKPLAIAAKFSEYLLVLIKSLTELSWGVVILIFAVVIKLILLPVSIMTAKSQERVSKINSQLQPQLKAIKSKYDGEQAHNKIMQAHKDLGVTPFYTLKPMLSFFIQIPILIAVFNALGEMPQLAAQPFLWFDDLSKPDMFQSLGFNIPLLGSYLNLMPVIMTIITLASTIYHKDNHASASDNKKQKIKLYLMAFSFFVLFYPFPAAMVMYWAMVNFLGFLQQKVLNKSEAP